MKSFCKTNNDKEKVSFTNNVPFKQKGSQRNATGTTTKTVVNFVPQRVKKQASAPLICHRNVLDGND